MSQGANSLKPRQYRGALRGVDLTVLAKASLTTFPFIESYPALDVGQLRFSSDEMSWNGTGGAAETALLLLVWRLSRLELTLIPAGGGPIAKTVTKIDFSRSAQHADRFAFFICPHTERPCKKLYVVGDMVASREYFGLRRRPIRPGERRPSAKSQRIDLRLRSSTPAMSLKPTWVDRALAQRSSFDRARMTEVESAQDRHITFLAQEPPPKVDERTLKTRVQEGFPNIAASDLRRAGFFVTGAWRYVALPWPPNSSCRETQIIIDLRDPKNPHAVFYSYFHDMTAARQVIPIVTPGEIASRRWAFICPRSGERVYSLFLREKTWGAAQSLRLIQASQRTQLMLDQTTFENSAARRHIRM